MQPEQNLPASCRLCVLLHGPLSVSKRVSDQNWKPVAWGQSRLARSVFRRLLTAPGRHLSRGQLADDLWPENDFEAADTSLQTTISLLRSAIGKDLITTWDGGYEVAGQALVWVDLDAAETLLKVAENQGHTALAALPNLEEALFYLERGAYLEEETGIWCHQFRKKSEDLQRSCRLWLAESYEKQGKLLQAGLQYRALLQLMPPNEYALQRWIAMLHRQGETAEALKCYQDAKAFVAVQGFTLSPTIEQAIASLDSSPSLAISRRSALTLLPSAAAFLGTMGSSFFADEFLAQYASGITACWDLYFGGQSSHVAAVLPLYRSQLTLLAQQASPFQRGAAALASQAWQLTQELAGDLEDFGSAHEAAKRALFAAQLAGNVNQAVSSLIRQANTFFHRKDAVQALLVYKQALPMLTNASPLLQGRVYAGLAEVYGMQGKTQDALRAMGMAYERYPEQPHDDPAYAYTRATQYSLRVFGDAQTRLFLGQPKEAMDALAYVEAHILDPQEEPLSKVDLLYYQISAAIMQGELERGWTLLAEAAALAKAIGSRLYFGKLTEIYTKLYAQYPQEAQVKALKEVFQVW